MYVAVREWYVFVITGKYLHHFVSHLCNMHVKMFQYHNYHTQNHTVLCVKYDIIYQLKFKYLLLILKLFC